MKMLFIPNKYSGGIGRDYLALQETILKIISDQGFTTGTENVIELAPKKPFLKVGPISFYWNRSYQCVLNAQFDIRSIILGKGIIIQRLHDLFPITNSHWFTFRSIISFRLAFKYLKRKEVIYVANSAFTRAVAAKYISQEKILIHYCKDTLQVSSRCNDCQGCRFSLNSQFCLFVGTIEPRKNYQIVPDIASKFKDLDFVVVGRSGWKYFDTLQNLSLVPNITYLGECCDYSLDKLYRECKAFISTSQQEGFNIPALEAQNRGAKLILSNIPVHREIFEGVAFFCDTIEDFVNGIRMLDDLNLKTLNELSYQTTLMEIVERLKWGK